MKVNLEQIYYLTQIIAVIAVIVSLTYVATQVQQNTQAIRTNTLESVEARSIDIFFRIGENSEIASIMKRGQEDISSLTDLEQYRFSVVYQGILRAWMVSYHHYQAGTLNADVFEPFSHLLKRDMRKPGLRSIWESSRQTFSDDFQIYMNNLIEKDNK